MCSLKNLPCTAQMESAWRGWMFEHCDGQAKAAKYGGVHFPCRIESWMKLKDLRSYEDWGLHICEIGLRSVLCLSFVPWKTCANLRSPTTPQRFCDQHEPNVSGKMTTRPLSRIAALLGGAGPWRTLSFRDGSWLSLAVNVG